MTFEQAVMVIVGLMLAIFILDVMPRRRRVAVTVSESELAAIAKLAPDDDDLVLDEVDVLELIDVESCMVEGRPDDARDRLERWLDEVRPDWRGLRR